MRNTFITRDPGANSQLQVLGSFWQSLHANAVQLNSNSPDRAGPLRPCEPLAPPTRRPLFNLYILSSFFYTLSPFAIVTIYVSRRKQRNSISKSSNGKNFKSECLLSSTMSYFRFCYTSSNNNLRCEY